MKGQIEKRGDGTYRVRWYEGRRDGRRVYGSKTIRGTKKQAERALREVLARQPQERRDHDEGECEQQQTDHLAAGIGFSGRSREE